MRMAVVSIHGKPLSPATPAKVRKRIQSGGAQPRRDPLGTFDLQLTTPTEKTIPHETAVGIDPGKLYSGIGAQTFKATLWLGHLVLSFPGVKKGTKTRTPLRRVRRYRTPPPAPVRLLHRTRHKIRPVFKPTAASNGGCCRDAARLIP